MTALSIPEKLALVKAAVAWGDRLRPALVVGASAGRLREIAGSGGDLTVTDSPTGLIIRFGAYVYWDVTVDGEGIVRGYSGSGYGDLMSALGMDLEGRPYLPGNGG